MLTLAARSAAFLIAASVSTLAAADTFTFNGDGGPIEDATAPTQAGAGVTFYDINVSGTNATVDSIRSVTLSGLTHSFIGDLGLYLVGPDGEKFAFLASPPEEDEANFNGTYTFTVNPALPTIDEAAAGRPTGYDLPGGNYATSEYGGNGAPGPRATFDDLAGEPLDGLWSLQIDDVSSGESGNLVSWSFTAEAAVVPEPTSLAALGLMTVLLRRRRA